MKRFSAATRISVGVTCVTLSLLLAAQGLGVLPNPNDAILKNRKQLCETLAIQCSLAAQRGNTEDIQNASQFIAERNPDVLSLGLRKEGGDLLVKFRDHEKQWKGADANKSTATHVRVPILEDDRRWGTLE